MWRFIWALCAVLFLVTACKPKVAELVREFVATEPHFQSSDTIIVDRVDGYTWVLPLDEQEYAICRGNQCEIDGQETTLDALLGAEGFNYLETYRGIHLGHSSIQHFEGEIQGYGGWANSSAFAVLSGILRDGTPGESGYAEEQLVHSYSVGHRPDTNPVSGGASWNGVMVGARIVAGPTAGDFVRGDATVTVDFAASDVDVDFRNVRGRDNGLNYTDMEWSNIPSANGTFEAGESPGQQYTETYGEADPTEANHIIGHFYGGDHQEVGGVFTKNSIQGAFGAKRQ